MSQRIEGFRQEPASEAGGRRFQRGFKRHLFVKGGLIGTILFAVLEAQQVFGQSPIRELRVHLVQANNDSPYTFVRAKFEPGEVNDPWSVRFFDSQGNEAPYYVWDSLTWKTAREGRPDWGKRYAALNHHPGNAPEALRMREHRLESARQFMPDLHAALAERDAAAKRPGDSVCAALYLVRHAVPAFGKDHLRSTLRRGSSPGCR